MNCSLSFVFLFQPEPPPVDESATTEGEDKPTEGLCKLGIV